MKIEITKVKYMCITCFLLLLLVSTASASTDALVDRSRISFNDEIQQSPSTINYVNARFEDVKDELYDLSYVYSIRDYTTGAASDSSFVNSGINSLDDTNDNIVLIHTHGTHTSSSSYLKFKDGSYLSDGEVDSWMDEREGGVMFAAACYSANKTDLGYSFIYGGFDSYVGYNFNVTTTRNARFYTSFFEEACESGVSVDDAADDALDSVWNEFGDYGNVDTYRIFGSSSYCLN